MSELTEYAAVLIDQVWRACVRPGEQWDAREMGVSAGKGKRGHRRAIQLAHNFQEKRGGYPTDMVPTLLTDGLETDFLEAATGSLRRSHGGERPIMGEPVKPPEDGALHMPNKLAMKNGRDIAVDDWGNTTARVDEFFLAFARAVMEEQGGGVLQNVVRALLIRGIDSYPPQLRDDLITRAEVIADERLERVLADEGARS